MFLKVPLGHGSAQTQTLPVAASPVVPGFGHLLQDAWACWSWKKPKSQGLQLVSARL
jgi:hypothetical protein